MESINDLIGFADDGLLVLDCETIVRKDSNGSEAVFVAMVLNQPDGEVWPSRSVDHMRDAVIDAVRASGNELPSYILLRDDGKRERSRRRSPLGRQGPRSQAQKTISRPSQQPSVAPPAPTSAAAPNPPSADRSAPTSRPSPSGSPTSNPTPSPTAANPARPNGPHD